MKNVGKDFEDRVLTFELPAPVLVVELALPDSKLSPNAKTGSGNGKGKIYGKAKIVKKYREAAAWSFIKAMSRKETFAEVTVQATFYFKRNARRDGLNMQLMLKPAIDGMQDAEVVSDDRYVTELPPIFRVDKARPRVELRVYDIRIEFQDEVA